MFAFDGEINVVDEKYLTLGALLVRGSLLPFVYNGNSNVHFFEAYIDQGYPTSIFGKYLFGRPFEI